MGDKIEKEEGWTEATDADITRVDLVTNPANGVDFILAKSTGLLTPEEVEALLAKSTAVEDEVEEETEPTDEEEPEGEEEPEPAAKSAEVDWDAFLKEHPTETFEYVFRVEGSDDFVKRTFTAEDRRRLAKSGEALPDGSYPIENGGDLHNAIHAVGRGSNHSHAEIHAHIVKRAKSLGLKAMLPKSWGQGGMAKSISATFSADTDQFRKALAEETALLRKASEERITSLEAELKKMADTPVPGGPMLAPPSGKPTEAKSEELTENQQRVAQFRKMAEDPGLDAAMRDKYLEAAKTLAAGS